MSSKILSITEVTPIDEAIQRYEYYAYEPTGTASYNYTGGEIRVNIERQTPILLNRTFCLRDGCLKMMTLLMPMIMR